MDSSDNSSSRKNIDVIVPGLTSSEATLDNGIPQNTYSDPPTAVEPVGPDLTDPLATEPTVSPVVTPEPPVSNAPSSEPNPTPDSSSPSDPSKPADDTPHHKGAPIGAIVVAIIVAAALAALVVFFYMRSKDDSITSDTPTASSQGSETTAANTSDVDETSQALDETLSEVDDNADFASSGLSDATLGL